MITDYIFYFCVLNKIYTFFNIAITMHYIYIIYIILVRRIKLYFFMNTVSLTVLFLEEQNEKT